MSNYEQIRTINGPKGTVEIAKEITILGTLSFRVCHVDTGRYVFYNAYDDAMRRALELSGLDPGKYVPEE